MDDEVELLVCGGELVWAEVLPVAVNPAPDLGFSLPPPRRKIAYTLTTIKATRASNMPRRIQ